jgi:aldose sugar dehydrogenase
MKFNFLLFGIFGIIIVTLIMIHCVVFHVFAADNNVIANDETLRINQMISGLDNPSGIEFINDDILVVEKNSGKVDLIRKNMVKKYPVFSVNSTNPDTASGLLGISAIQINEAWYVYIFTTERINGTDSNISENGLRNKVYRFLWNSSGLELTDRKTIVDSFSQHSSTNIGGKIEIGPDMLLYVTLGDMNHTGEEQNIPRQSSSFNPFFSDGGKNGAILRLTLDGKPSPYNPFTEPGFESYFAFGIRNSFGIGFDPVTNYLWDTEQGPGSFDEINLVKPGFNSGWKAIHGNSSMPCCNTTDMELSQNIHKLYNIRGSYYDDPKVVFPKSPLLTDLIFINSSKLGSQYANTMFVGDLEGNIYNFKLSSNRENVVNSNNLTNNIIMTGFGPISDLHVGPDGLLYVVTYSNNTSKPYNTNTGSIYTVSANNIETLKTEQDIITIELMAIVLTIALLLIMLGVIGFRKHIVNKVRTITSRKQ